MDYTNLVEKAKKKDEKAIAELFESTSQKGYFVALKYLKNKEDAQDILQDSYVSALSKLDQLQDSAKFDKWLFQIISNKAKNYLMKNKPLLFEQLDSEEEDAVQFEDTIQEDRLDYQPKETFDAKELKEAMKSIIDELPEDQRMCLLMYYFEEFSVSEISETLEISGNTVKSRLNYARIKVKTKIEDLQKKGTHLYGVTPIPLMVWVLRNELKATIVPKGMGVQITSHLGSSIVRDTIGKSVGKTIAEGVTKKSILIGSKTVTTKVITGTLIASLAVGGGYVYVQSQGNEKTEDQEIVDYEYEEKSMLDSEDTKYEVLSEDIPQFEETPIDIKGGGYIVKVDGKYGFIDENGKWLLKNKYPVVFRSFMGDERANDYCFQYTDEKGSDGDSLDYAVGEREMKRCGTSNFGSGVSDIRLTVFDSNPQERFVYNMMEDEIIPPSEFYEQSLIPGFYDDAYRDWSENSFYIVNPIDDNKREIADKYYVVSKTQKTYGPYTLEDKIAFNFDPPTMTLYHTKVKGIFLGKTKDGYDIFDANENKIWPETVSNAELLSYSAVKIKHKNKIAVIDDRVRIIVGSDRVEGHLALFGEFEDVSNPINGKAYVKIDGKWKLISINE